MFLSKLTNLSRVMPCWANTYQYLDISFVSRNAITPSQMPISSGVVLLCSF